MKKAQLNGIGSAVVVLLLTIHVSQAAIVKLDLAKTPGPDLGPDIVYTGAVLATPNDGNNFTTGRQDTSLVFGDILFNVPPTTGSYTLDGLQTNGQATTAVTPGGTLVFQPMKNGNFQVYDSANNKLLDVDLTNSNTLLTGTLNSPTGGLITVTNATVTGGVYAQFLVANSISFSIALSNIFSDNATGALVLGGGNILHEFTASATKEIGAAPNPLGAPEPSSAILLALGCLCGAIIRRRRR